MKTFKKIQTTTNSSVYRKLRKQEIANKTGICTYCGYHRGENITGYCGTNASWKLVCKKSKQFLVGKKIKKDRMVKYSSYTVCFW